MPSTALRNKVAKLVLGAACLAATATWAETAVSERRAPDDLALDATALGTFARTGALVEVKAHYQHRLFQSDDEVFADNFFGVGFVSQTSPVFEHLGAYVEVQPAAFVKVTAGYEAIGYFGTLGTMRLLDGCRGAAGFARTDTTCDFSPDVDSAAPGASGFGHRLFSEVALMGQVSRFVAAVSVKAEGWFMNPTRASEAKFWFNELHLLPMARADFALLGSGALFFELLHGGHNRPQLLLGLSDDFGFSLDSGYVNNRVGPAAVLRFPTLGAFRELCAVLVVQPWTNERYLKGGMPFIGLVLSAATPNFLSSQER